MRCKEICGIQAILRVLTLGAVIFWSVLMGASAHAVVLYGGVARSDLGGQSNSGIVIGVGNAWDLGGGPFSLVFAGEYIEKGGETDLIYSSGFDGSILYEGKGYLSLGYFQPTLSLGASAEIGKFQPSIYLGGGIGFLVYKSLDAPDAPDSIWDHLHTINDTDIVGLIGVALKYDRVEMGFQYCRGANEVFPWPEMAGEKTVFTDHGARNTSLRATLGWVF